MISEKTEIDSIPVIIWGKESNKAYIVVHGKMGCKEDASLLAEIAENKGYQVISFDLPEHGERLYTNYKCTVQNGVNDLNRILAYAKERWENLSLYACSLGAYFSLVAYKDIKFTNCLFLSPVLDMERLITNMMLWFNVTEKDLEFKKEIETPMGETLSWDYFQYVRENRISKWNSTTKIIFGDKDNLTEREAVDSFVSKYKAELTVIQNGEHFLHSVEDIKAVKQWIEKNV